MLEGDMSQKEATILKQQGGEANVNGFPLLAAI